jgi:hypothetical protein
MILLRRAIQIIAILLLTLTLLWPPYKFIWRYSLEHTQGEITGFLGYDFVFSPPDNPLLIAKTARARLTLEGTPPPKFDHRTDSVEAEMDVGRLLLQLLGICAAAAILTAIIDRKVVGKA